MHSNRTISINGFDAVEQPDGSYLNNMGTILWYNELGEYNREDGPALIYANGKVRWCLKNKIYSFDRWLFKLNKPDEVKMLLRLRYA
jgi:hypothetical protein